MGHEGQENPNAILFLGEVSGQKNLRIAPHGSTNRARKTLGRKSLEELLDKENSRFISLAESMILGQENPSIMFFY